MKRQERDLGESWRSAPGNRRITLSDDVTVWVRDLKSGTERDGVQLVRENHDGWATDRAWVWRASEDLLWVAWTEFEMTRPEQVAKLAGDRLELVDVENDTVEIKFRSFTIAPRRVTEIGAEEYEVPPRSVYSAFADRISDRDPPAELCELVMPKARNHAHDEAAWFAQQIWGEPGLYFEQRSGRPNRSLQDDERDAGLADALVDAYAEHGRGQWRQPFMAEIGETGDPEAIVQRLVEHRFIQRDRQPFRLAYKARLLLGKWD